MATKSRKSQKNSESHRLSIERFAYDVFSCILPILGFPETSLLSTDIEENIYINNDFVKKASLSVLPIAMYMRDQWKQMFEYRHRETGFNSLKMIQSYLIRLLIQNLDFRNADKATKIRVSLALFNEIMLFFKYKGLVTHAESLPKFWSDFYLENIARSQDIEKLFVSSFLMFPEVSETPEWIIPFVEKYAIPYGRLNKVSEIFSVYSILSDDSKSSPLKKMSKSNATQQQRNIPDEFVTANVTSQKSRCSSTEVYQPALPVTSIDLKIKGHVANTSSEENSNLERKTCRKQSTPSTDIFELNPNGQQRKSSELAVKDAFSQMSLDSAYVS